MFAVKSTYSIKTPDGKDIPFYVAGDSIFFAVNDLMSDIHTEIFPACYFRSFENYALRFISLDNLKHGVLNYTAQCFYKNEAFWVHFVCHNDTKKVIAEVNDAQTFIQDELHFTLPEEWDRFNPSNLVFDTLLTNLHEKPTPWIEKYYTSLQILATNDEQKQAARRVYDKAWKILKAREKADNKYTALHEVLAKFGLAVDDLIQAVLNVHETKFDKQHDELLSELRMLLK